MGRLLLRQRQASAVAGHNGTASYRESAPQTPQRYRHWIARLKPGELQAAQTLKPYRCRPSRMPHARWPCATYTCTKDNTQWGRVVHCRSDQHRPQQHTSCRLAYRMSLAAIGQEHRPQELTSPACAARCVAAHSSSSLCALPTMMDRWPPSSMSERGWLVGGGRGAGGHRLLIRPGVAQRAGSPLALECMLINIALQSAAPCSTQPCNLPLCHPAACCRPHQCRCRCRRRPQSGAAQTPWCAAHTPAPGQ